MSLASSLASRLLKSWHPFLRGQLLAALGITEQLLCGVVFRIWTGAWFSNPALYTE